MKEATRKMVDKSLAVTIAIYTTFVCAMAIASMAVYAL